MGKGIAYSAPEKQLIIELVQKYNVVENKKTDSTSIHEKNKAWEKITEEFNAMGDHPNRNLIQVKKCWNNIKAKRKSEITSHKQALLRTGGGPEVPKLVDDPTIDQFANIAIEIPGAIDSDTIAAGNVLYSVTSHGEFSENFSLSDLSGNDDLMLNTNHIQNELTSTQIATEPSCSSQINLTENKKDCKNIKIDFTSEISARMKRLENQISNDNEIHELLKQEILLKIENEKELLKRRKIETKTAEIELISCQEKYNN